MTKQKLLLRAIIKGTARWEPLEGDPKTGEVCIDGLRYATHLDRDGVPNLHSVIESALRRSHYQEQQDAK